MSPSRAGSEVARELPQQAIAVDESSQIGEARRAAVALAGALALDETLRGKLAIVVTELATNLVRHGGGGRILLRALGADEGVDGVEVIAVDAGAGIHDLQRAFQDGYSTGGTAGTGLGAVRRQSSAFDVYSAPRKGTAIVARLRSDLAPHTLPRATAGALELGVVTVPAPGERVCGDAWAALAIEGRTRLLVADGLGHGVDAAAAAGEAVRIFRAHADRPLPDLLRLMHGALRSTRGAAVAVADVGPGTVRYAGVGNIAASIVATGMSHSLVSLSGTVGHAMHRVQEFNYPWPAGGRLVMHSDGVSARWRMDEYPGLLLRDPSLLAAVLQRDFGRGRDDATVLVASQPARAARAGAPLEEPRP